MKQGRASSSSPGSRKIEPRPHGVNPAHVANIGLQQLYTRHPPDTERGYKAPMAGSSRHPRGTQGKH